MMHLRFLGILALLQLLFITAPTAQNHTSDEKIHWMSWEEVQEALKKEKRPVIVDVYTHWCGWCKVMDRKTFSDKEVIRYINKHFYAVKFNAEQRQPITFKGKTYELIGSGRRKVNRLAYELLRGRLAYPTILYMDENLNTIVISPGYKDVPALMKEMRYITTKSYKTTPWKSYQ